MLHASCSKSVRVSQAQATVPGSRVHFRIWRPAHQGLFSETKTRRCAFSVHGHYAPARSPCCCCAICPSPTVEHTTFSQAYSRSPTHATSRHIICHALSSAMHCRLPRLKRFSAALILCLSTQCGSSNCLIRRSGLRIERLVLPRQSA